MATTSFSEPGRGELSPGSGTVPGVQGDWLKNPNAAERPIHVVALMEAYSITGPAKNLLEFAQRTAAAKESARLSIVTFQRGRVEQSNSFIDAARSVGVTVEVIAERRAFDIGIIRKLRNTVHNLRPDIIQTHGVKSHFLVWLTGLCRSYPWIAIHHGYTWPDLKTRVYNQLDRLSLPSADTVVTVCQPFADELAEAGVAREKMLIHSNAVRPFVAPLADEVQALRVSLGIPNAAAVILSAGRLSREKGHVDLLAALAKVKAEAGIRDFRLVIAGEGPERERIQQSADHLGIADRVLMPGHQANMEGYYAMADLVVLPSHSEGCPNVLLEAMAAGLAIVATNVGGVPEIATDRRDALLVRSGDIDGMASAIVMLMPDASLRSRLGDAAKTRAADFTFEKAYGRTLTNYQRLMHREALPLVSASE